MRGAVFIIALATSVITSRVLGPAQKGSLSIIFLVVSTAQLFVLFGLGSSNVYYGAKNRAELPILTGNSIVAACTLGLLSIVFVETLTLVSSFQNYFINNNVSLFWVRLVIVVVPFALLIAYLQEITRASGDIFTYNIIALVNILIQFISVACFVWYAEWELQGAVLARIVSYGIVALIVLAVVLRIIRNKPQFDQNLLRRNFKYGIRLYPGNLAQFLNYRLDLFIVAYFLTPAEIGYYAIATMLAERLWEIPGSIRTVLLYRVAATNDKSSAAIVTARASRVVLVFVGIICLVLAIFSYPLTLFLFGREYIAVAPALIALMPGVWILSCGKLLAIHLAAVGQPEISTYAAVLSLIATIVLDILLVPSMGIVGAAIASTISYIFATVILVVAFIYRTNISLADIIFVQTSDITIVREFTSQMTARLVRKS